MSKILIVEDDAELLDAICEWLKKEHHVVEVADTGKLALELLQCNKYDLMILDWQLPGLSGLEVCKEFRLAGGSIPILMLTAKGEIKDKEAGFEAGADDYLTKPFHPRELNARIRALLRRPSQVWQPILQVGELILETKTRCVIRGDQKIQLLPKEYALLEFLMRYPGSIFSAEAILERLWPSDSEASPDTVRMHIARLRGKIDKDGCPSLIRTVHRVGYSLVGDQS